MKLRNLLTFALGIFFVYACFPVSTAAQDLRGVLLTVNSTGDTRDANSGDGICADAAGDCTLRAAVEETNSNATQDAIIFDVPQPAVIDLTFGPLLIVQNLDILGPGARQLTVRRSTAAGTLNFRIFETPPTTIFVNIRSMTISNGNAFTGGALFVENGGNVGLLNCAVTGNRAAVAGAIIVFGKLTIVRTLINSNTSDNHGGAIVNANSVSDLTITNSTITGNSASTAGAIDNSGSLVLVNSTIAGNSASSSISSIRSNSSGTVKVLNTIIGPDIGQPSLALLGTFQSAGNNIVTNSTGSTGFTHGVNGDQVSTNNAIDPMLGPLANNGGQTDTFALLTGSPARLAGNACARTAQCPLLAGVTFPSSRLDQRRFRRSLIAAQIDVGAFDTAAQSAFGLGSLTLLGLGTPPISRYAGSHAFMINPATLERRHATIRLNGNITFSNLSGADAYVIEIKSKRAGLLTPLVFTFDF